MNTIRFEPDGGNRTPGLVRALLHAQDGTTLSFAKGVYDFYGDGVYRGYFCPGCNRSSDKKVVFPLLHLNNITIDGNGAQFLFHDRLFPFVVQGCRGVTLRNFSIDFSFPRCCEAVVAGITDEGFMLKIDKNVCDYDVNSDGNMLIRAGTKVFSTCERKFFVEQQKKNGPCCFYLIPGKSFCRETGLPAGILRCTAEKRSGGVFLRWSGECDFRPDIIPGKIYISYDEQRDNDVMFFENSSDVRIENVRIYRGAGMGVVGQCCENMTIDGLTVSPHEGESCATTADAILLTNFSGKLTVENCRIEHTLDDAMSVHGFYSRVERVLGPRWAAVRMQHVSQGGINVYFPGDRVVVTDSEGRVEKGGAVVKEAWIQDDPYLIFIEFEEDIAELLEPGDYIENPGRTPETVIRNNFFSDFPNLRLGSAKKTVFENNTVRNCCAVAVNDLMQYWYASGRARDVEIKNNVFENMSGVQVVMARGEGSVRHENVRVVGNTFRNCACALDAERVDGLTFRGNRLENVGEAARVRDCVNTDIEEE